MSGLKISLTTLFATIGLVLSNQHVFYSLCFAALVVLDLLTKQLAISAQCIEELKGIKKEELDTYTKICGIPFAFSNGYIRSKLMRKKFFTKMATYFFIILAAMLCNQIINAPELMVVNLCYSYLGATEFISILENLRDGGNTTTAKLLEIANNKLFSKLNNK